MNSLYDKLQVLEPESGQFSKEERLNAMVGPLLVWYEEHARCLPWREDPKPYSVWISEIMLQQTRVEAVKPFFEAFMEALPHVRDLAYVDEEKLLKLWQGLGYYNRARNLKKAAQILMDEYEGELPASYEKLMSLPGIGSYTAGAIASIAYGLPVPAVDGNVLRVISRVTGSHADILKQSVKKQMEADLKRVIPPNDASRFNQGLIEIGALVCVPNGQPKCGECPFYTICLARKRDELSLIPVKATKKARRLENKTVLLLEYDSQIAIRKRKDTGLLASLYELPNLDGHWTAEELSIHFKVDLKQVEQLPDAKHIFSHVEWHMAGYRICLKQKTPNPDIFVSIQELRSRYPLPNAFNAYTKLIK